VKVNDPPLVGRRVLVAVDNHIVAADVRQAVLLGGGFLVGPTATSAGALRLIEKDAPNAAVIGAVLEDQLTTLVADRLAELSIPFVLVTGLPEGTLPLSLRKVVHVIKPFLRGELIQILAAAIAEAKPCRPEPKSDSLDDFEASSMRLS
jgi:CheY-like chemotaxis protein